MALNIDINSTSIFAARDAVRDLEKEYGKLQSQIESLNKAEAENGRLTIAQQKEFESLNQAMKPLNTQMNEYYSTLDSLDPNNFTAKFEDMYGAVQPLTTQISELEDRLYQMRLEGDNSSEMFTQISERVATMKSVIKETDTQIDILAANKGISGIRDQFSALGSSLLDLNFDNASKSLDGLNKNIKNINGKEKAGEMMQFGKTLGKTLVSSIQAAIKVTWQFTAALLANPIILIAAVVVTLGVVMYQLKDKIEVFMIVFESLGAVVDYVMGLFQGALDLINKFTDYLGLTNVAETKLLEDRKKNAEKEAALMEQRVEAQNNALNNELRILQAKGVNSEEEIEQERILKEEVLKNEKLKLDTKIAVHQAEINLLRSKRKLTDEEKDLLKEQEDALKSLALEANNISTDIELNNIAAAQKQEKRVEGENKKTEEEAKKHQEKLSKQRAEYAKKKAAQDKLAEEEAKRRADAMASIASIEAKEALDALENEYDKTYLTTINALDKERKEVLSNTSLTEEEIAKIKSYYNALELRALETQAKEKRAFENGELEKSKKWVDKSEQELLDRRLAELKKSSEKSRDAAIKYNQESNKAQMDALIKERDLILADEKLTADERLAIQKYYETKSEQMTEDHRKSEEQITADWDKKELDQFKAKWQNINDSITSGMDTAALGIAEGMFNVTSGLLSAFDTIKKVLEDEEASIGEKAAAIAGAVLGMANQILGEIQKAQNAKVEESINSLKETTSEQMGELDSSLKQGLITQQEYEQSKYALELEAWKKEEMLRKEAFEAQKKMSIASSIINTITGMVGVFASAAANIAAPAGFIIGGIMAAAVGVMGALNIAKIKSTKYKSSAAPSAPSAPSINTGSIDMKTIDGADENAGKYSADKPMEQNPQNQPQPVIQVSVTEINEVQGRVAGYEMASEL